jgi:hypothetical protein
MRRADASELDRRRWSMRQSPVSELRRRRWLGVPADGGRCAGGHRVGLRGGRWLMCWGHRVRASQTLVDTPELRRRRWSIFPAASVSELHHGRWSMHPDRPSAMSRFSPNELTTLYGSRDGPTCRVRCRDQGQVDRQGVDLSLIGRSLPSRCRPAPTCHRRGSMHLGQQSDMDEFSRGASTNVFGSRNPPRCGGRPTRPAATLGASPPSTGTALPCARCAQLGADRRTASQK